MRQVDAQTPDLFVSLDDISNRAGSLEVRNGDVVSFKATEALRGPRAVCVVVLEQAAGAEGAA